MARHSYREKLQKSAERDAKADAKQAAKQERQALEAAEDAANAAPRGKKAVPAAKITQAEIARRQALAAAANAASMKPKAGARSQVVAQPILEPNRNREIDVVDATGLDSALSALAEARGSVNKQTEKASMNDFAQFEKAERERIKLENPGLRETQIKDAIRKKWTRSLANAARAC